MLKREHKVSNISSEAIFAIPAMKPSRVIFASIFCLFLMVTDIKYESGSYIRSFSNDILKPITFLTRFPLQIYENFNLFFSSRVSLEKKLQSLQEENLKLKATNQFMEKISIDNNKLNALWSSLTIDKERFLISKKSFLNKTKSTHQNFIDPSKITGDKKTISQAYKKCREEIKVFTLKYLEENFLKND